MYVCVCTCACVYRCLQKSEDGIRAHEAAVTGGHKSLDMDAGHPASLLWRAAILLHFWAIYFPFPLIKFFCTINFGYVLSSPIFSSIFPILLPSLFMLLQKQNKTKIHKNENQSQQTKNLVYKVTKQNKIKSTHFYFFKKRKFCFVLFTFF